MAEYISYIYRIVDKYTPILNKINSSTKKFRSTAIKAQQGIGKLGSKMSSLQNIAGTMAATVGGATALNKYKDFSSSMNTLESVTFATGEQMKQMGDKAKFLGATTAFTAGEAAQGMTYLAMAGLDTNKVLKAIPKTLELAAAGGLSLAEAADISTNVLGQMKLGVEDLSHVNDVLALAQSKANFNITELFEAMRPAATTAGNLGISLEQLTAYLGAMANAGEKGSIAGTLFRNALTEIAGAGPKQIKIYKALGINLKDFLTESGKIKDLDGLMERLRGLDKQGKLTVPILQALYGDRGFRAVQTILGTTNEQIKEFTNNLVHSDNAAKKAAAIKMKGLPGIMASLASAFEAVNIAIFESGLDQIIIEIAGDIANLARRVAKMNPTILKAVGVFGLVVTVLGPLTVGFGFLFTAIGAISVPVLAVGAALVGMTAALYEVWKNWDYLVMDIKAGVNWILEKFQAVQDLSVKIGEIFGRGLRGLITGKSESKGIFSELKTVFGLDKKGVASENSIVSKQSLNGNIVVSAEKGASVRGAKMKTSVPGNLGFNIAGSQ